MIDSTPGVRRRPSASRMSSWLLVLCLSVASLSAADAMSDRLSEQANFNIPAQPLGTSLKQLATQAGIQILFEEQVVRGLQAPAIKSHTTPREALLSLLKGTDLEFVAKDHTVAVRKKLPRAGSFSLPLDDGQPGTNAAPDGTSPAASQLNYSQTNDPSQSSPAGADPTESGETRQPGAGSDKHEAAVAEVVVTGTHIVSPGYEAPTPVTVASADELMKSAPTSIPDALNKLPQFSGSSSPQTGQTTFANTPDHGNVLSLRGLGAIRTLVLLDGVRLPPTTYLGTVDVDVLPQLLVKQVDVVTAGASSAYGSDAVAGVVNFVLDTKFSGVKGIAQRGISSRGDDGSFRVAVAGGTDLGNRVHVIGSFDHYQNDGFLQQDRRYIDDQGQAVGSVIGTDAPPGTAGNPQIFQSGLRYNLASFGGLAVDGPFANTTFPSPGVYRDAITGTPTGTAGFYQGGDYYYGPGTQSAAAGLNNSAGFGRLNIELTEDLQGHVQTIVAQSKINYQGLPNLLFFQPIFSGNAFLPAALQQQLDSTGTSAFDLNKEMREMGPLSTRERLTNYDVLTGLDGKLGTYHWSVNYSFGRSQHDVAQSNLIENTQFAAAIDAVVDPTTGQIVCRPTLDASAAVRAQYAGCVPFNPFGEGASSQAARDYVTGVSRYEATNTTNDVSATISGEILQVPAGAMSAALGVEYRTQKLDLTSNADPSVAIDISGLRGLPDNTPRFYLTDVGTARGQNNVKEAFGEVAVPILKDAPFAKGLDLNGAVRFTDYSTSGSATTWKAGLSWSPIDDLRFRATRSRDIRAPTLYDLFAGSTFNIGAAFDPLTNLNGTYAERTSGNPTLKPEVGNTLSAGFVYQPAQIPDLALAVDYYDVRIEKAIATIGSAQVLQDCYRSNGTSPECDLIKRPFPITDHSAANYPTEVDVVGVNIASIKTRGVDLEASFRKRIAGGMLTSKLYATYVQNYLSQLSANQPFVDYAGYNATGSGSVPITIPKLKAMGSLNYDIGPLSVFLQEQVISGIKLDPTLVWAQPSIPAVFYTDATVSYRLGVKESELELFATVTNVFDKHAPTVDSTTAPGIGLSTIVGLYDTTGRYFNFGVRMRL